MGKLPALQNYCYRHASLFFPRLIPLTIDGGPKHKSLADPGRCFECRKERPAQAKVASAKPETQLWLMYINDHFGRSFHSTTTFLSYSILSRYFIQFVIQPAIPFDPLRPVLSLPLELQYLILRSVFSAGDYNTIFSCRLVSRSWNIEWHRTALRFIRLSHRNLKSPFLRAVRSAPSYIIANIEELEISSPTCGIMEVCRISHTLPHLQAFHFICQDSPESPVHPRISQFFPRILSKFSSLKILHIHAYVFHSLQDILRLCQNARALETLECTEVRFITHTTTESLPSTLRHGQFRLKRALLQEMDRELFHDQVWFWTAPKCVVTGEYPQVQLGPQFPGLNHEDADIIRLLLEECLDRTGGSSEWELREVIGCSRWMLRVVEKQRYSNKLMTIVFFIRIEDDHAGRIELAIFRDPYSISKLSQQAYWGVVDKYFTSSALPSLRGMIFDTPDISIGRVATKKRFECPSSVSREQLDGYLIPDVYHDLWEAPADEATHIRRWSEIADMFKLDTSPPPTPDGCGVSGRMSPDRHTG